MLYISVRVLCWGIVQVWAACNVVFLNLQYFICLLCWPFSPRCWIILPPNVFKRVNEGANYVGLCSMGLVIWTNKKLLFTVHNNIINIPWIHCFFVRDKVVCFERLYNNKKLFMWCNDVIYTKVSQRGQQNKDGLRLQLMPSCQLTLRSSEICRQFIWINQPLAPLGR